MFVVRDELIEFGERNEHDAERHGNRRNAYRRVSDDDLERSRRNLNGDPANVFGRHRCLQPRCRHAATATAAIAVTGRQPRAAGNARRYALGDTEESAGTPGWNHAAAAFAARRLLQSRGRITGAHARRDRQSAGLNPHHGR